MAEPPFGHEPSGLDVQRVAVVGAILMGSLILSVALVLFIAHGVMEPAHRRSHERVGVIPPAPRLQAHPGLDLEAVRRQEQRQLESWGWTDSTHEYARIPIEEAMSLYLRQQASPGRGAAASGARAPSRMTAPPAMTAPSP